MVYNEETLYYLTTLFKKITLPNYYCHLLRPCFGCPLFLRVDGWQPERESILSHGTKTLEHSLRASKFPPGAGNPPIPGGVSHPPPSWPLGGSACLSQHAPTTT